MGKAKPRSQQPSGGSNLVLAVCLLTAFAGLSAFASAYIAGVVLDLWKDPKHNRLVRVN